MFTKTLSYLTLPLLLLLSNSSGNSAQSPSKSSQGDTGTLEKMIVTYGNVALDLDLNQLNATSSSGQESNQETLRFQVSSNSFFTALVYDNLLRDLEPGTIGLIPQNTANLPQSLAASLHQLVLEKRQSGEAFELVIRDGKTNLDFFKIDAAEYHYSVAARSLSINGRLLLSEDFAKQLGLPSETPRVVGKISVTASMQSIEVRTIVNGEVQSAVLPALHGGGERRNDTGPGCDRGEHFRRPGWQHRKRPGRGLGGNGLLQCRND